MQTYEREQAIGFFEANIANDINKDNTANLLINHLPTQLKEKILTGNSEQLRTYFNDNKSLPDSMT